MGTGHFCCRALMISSNCLVACPQWCQVTTWYLRDFPATWYNNECQSARSVHWFSVPTMVLYFWSYMDSIYVTWTLASRLGGRQWLDYVYVSDGAKHTRPESWVTLDIRHQTMDWAVDRDPWTVSRLCLSVSINQSINQFICQVRQEQI